MKNSIFIVLFLLVSNTYCADKAQVESMVTDGAKLVKRYEKNGKTIFHNKNLVKGIKLLKEAIALGSLDAKFYLGKCYKYIPDKKAEGQKMLDEAFQKGNFKAIGYKGKQLLQDNPEEGLILLKKAANGGCISSQKHLVFYYTFINKDLNKSFKYNLMAAENGHYNSIKTIIAFYKNGTVVEKSDEKVVYWQKVLLDKHEEEKKYQEERQLKIYEINLQLALDEVKLIIEKNDFKQNDKLQMKLLQKYSELGYNEVLDLLVKNGVDISKSKSALHSAILGKKFETVKYLIDKGAKITQYCLDSTIHDNQIEILKHLLENGLEINPKSGESPLQIASEKGSADIVKLILSYKPKLDYCEPRHGTALYQACNRAHAKIVDLLLKAGTDVNVKGTDSSIHQPAFYGALPFPDVLKIVIKNGANINDYVYGETPLLNAIKRGLTKGIETLLIAGCDVNLRTKSGKTPLDLVTRRYMFPANEKKQEEVRALLKKYNAKHSSELK